MRLPGITYNRGVQSLGRPDIGGPGRVAAAQAAATRMATGLVAGTALMAGEIADSEAISQELIKARSSVEDFKRSIDGQMSFDGDGLPESPDYDRQETVFDAQNGKPIKQSRRVSAAEAVPVLTGKHLDGIRKTAMENLSPGQYRAFAKQFDEVDFQTRDQLSDYAAKMGREAGRATAIKDAGSLVEAGKPVLAADRLADTGYFTEAERSQLLEDLSTNNAIQSVHTAVATENVAGMRNMLDQLQSDDYDGPLEGRYRTAAIASLESGITDATAEQVAAEKQRKAHAVGQLDIDVHTGKKGLLDIEKAYQSDLLTPNERVRLTKSYYSRQAQKTELLDMSARVSDALAGNLTMSPSSKDDRVAVDMAYKADQTDEFAMRLVSKTNILPETRKTTLEGSAINGDIQTASQDLSFFMQLQEAHPQSLHKLDTRADAVFSTASAMVRGGADPQASIQLVRDNLKIPDAEKDALKRQLATDKKDTHDAEALTDFMDADPLFDTNWGPFSDVATTTAMQADFKAGADQYYLASGGDINLARKASYDNMRRVWGTTGVGGRIVEGKYKPQHQRAMRYAPERMTGRSTDDVQSALNLYSASKGLPSDGVAIHSDNITARSGSRPTYQVQVYDEETGFTKPIMNAAGSGWMRFDPNIWLKEADAGIRAENVAEARRVRDEEIAAQAGRAERRTIKKKPGQAQTPEVQRAMDMQRKAHAGGFKKDKPEKRAGSVDF